MVCLRPCHSISTWFKSRLLLGFAKTFCFILVLSCCISQVGINVFSNGFQLRTLPWMWFLAPFLFLRLNWDNLCLQFFRYCFWLSCDLVDELLMRSGNHFGRLSPSGKDKNCSMFSPCLATDSLWFFGVYKHWNVFETLSWLINSNVYVLKTLKRISQLPIQFKTFLDSVCLAGIWQDHLLYSRLHNNHGALGADEKPCVFITCRLSDSWIQQIKKNVWKLPISTNKKSCLK